MILIVDDDVDSMMLMQKYLSEYAVSTCSSIDAVRILAQGKTNLLITDLAMPFVSGLELARIAKNVHKVPVIAVTGYSSHSERLHESRYIDAVLQKPFTKLELVDTVTKTLEL